MSPTIPPNVIRLPCPDGEESCPFVMVHVKSNGRRPLDLRLVGTDNADIFHGQLRQNRISESKASGCSLSDAEWEAVFASLLLARPWPDSPSVAGIDAAAKIEGNSMTIQIRKHVQGITQRLGSIKLDLKSDLTVDLFEWCGLLADSRLAVQKSLEEANAQVTRLEASVAGLKEQLDEFIKAKEHDETELLEKFKTLLNEKKVKIREQQRLLTAVQQNPALAAGGGADGDIEVAPGIERTSREVKVKDEPLERDAEPAPARKPRKAPTQAAAAAKPPRTSKRKIAQVEEDSDSDAMELDNEGAPLSEPESEDEDHMTEDEETADESDSDIEEPPAPSSLDTVRGSQYASVANAESSSGSGFAIRSASKALEAPPPRRELPFAMNRGRRNAPAACAPAKKAAPPSKSQGECETDSDDEL